MPSFPHPYPFDPTYGYTFERLLQVSPPAAPSDFDAFWRSTFDETIAIPPRVTTECAPELRDGFEITVARFNSLNGQRIGGWLFVPTAGKPTRFVVAGHGYGNPDLGWFNPGPDTVLLAVHKRGFGLSRCAGIPDEVARHVLTGIESRESYVHRGCVADLWAGASAMLELFPQAAGRLEYAGGSFGGGIGAMALPWDDRFVFAALDVPSFGNHPLRVTLPCVGSGAAVRAKVEHRPRTLEVLQYFDAAIHALRSRIPTHVSCALFDPAVPPPGQFCVFNAMNEPKALFARQASHFEFAGAADDEAKRQASIQAFREQHFRPLMP